MKLKNDLRILHNSSGSFRVAANLVIYSQNMHQSHQNRGKKINHMWPDEPENSKTPLAQNIVINIVIIIIAGLIVIPLAIILSGLK